MTNGGDGPGEDDGRDGTGNEQSDGSGGRRSESRGRHSVEHSATEGDRSEPLSIDSSDDQHAASPDGDDVDILGEPTPTDVARARGLARGPITEYTTVERTLDETVQIQWGVWTAVVSVILGLITSAILGNFGVPLELAMVSIGLFLGLGAVWVVFRYRAWRYQVREDSLYLERGVVTNVRTIVPYVRVQHVDTSKGPLERALGLSTLVVYTAGSRGADVSVPGLKPEEARDLQQRLKELAIAAEGDDAV